VAIYVSRKTKPKNSISTKLRALIYGNVWKEFKSEPPMTFTYSDPAFFNIPTLRVVQKSDV
jgi:hypothetical protein